jgi:hypothetical protein
MQQQQAKIQGSTCTTDSKKLYQKIQQTAAHKMSSSPRHTPKSTPASSWSPGSISPMLGIRNNNCRSRIARSLRRSTTMPAQRFSGVVSPRITKLMGDVNRFIDDNSTSATSFLSESLMNMSLSGRSVNGDGYSFGGSHPRSSPRRRMCPTDLALDEFREFVNKILPEHVPDQELVSMLQDEVKHHPPTPCSGSLTEIDDYLATILESSPSIPATVVADLHTYRGLVYLMRGNQQNNAAIEAFTRALWLQTHLMRLAVEEQDVMVRLLDLALTEHRLGVAYGRNKQYVEAIDQIQYAIQSYERAKVGISECCYVSAKEDLHEFIESRQIDMLRSSGRALRRSMLVRRSKSADGERCQNGFRRTQSDATTRGARRPGSKRPPPVSGSPVPVEVAVVSY